MSDFFDLLVESFSTVYSFLKFRHFLQSYPIPHVIFNNIYKKNYKLYDSAIEDFFSLLEERNPGKKDLAL